MSRYAKLTAPARGKAAVDGVSQSRDLITERTVKNENDHIRKQRLELSIKLADCAAEHEEMAKKNTALSKH